MNQPQQPLIAGPGARPSLARDLAEFLIELSIVLNRFSIYPSGHPSLHPAADGLLLRCEQLLGERSALSVGVARQQLIIEGVATDPKNPVLKDLAERLNRQQLGAISLTRGLEAGELIDFLTVVAAEPERGAAPISVAHDPRTAAWSHVRLFPPMYDRLELVEDEGVSASDDPTARSQRTRAAQLWIGLARAALSAGDSSPAEAPVATEAAPEPDAVPTDPAAVARAIESHPSGAAYDQVIVGYMLQIAEELRSAGGREALHLQKRMSRLISALDPKTLQRLLEMGGDGMQRRTFLTNATHGMSVDAVVELIRAASGAEQQTISSSLLRMLQKLARHADNSGGERRRVAEESVRDQVDTMLRGWSLADPNPEAYGKALEAMARADAQTSHGVSQIAEPQRIVAMALELDVMGEPVERAVAELIETGFLRWMLEALDTAPPSAAQAALMDLIATPENLAEALSAEPIDTAIVDALLPSLGMRAAPVLLDNLAEVEEARLRRLLLDRLVQLGPEIAVLVVARLQDPRWYVQRNMLKLLGDLEELVVAISPAGLIDHADARVRREALRVLLRDPIQRENAILRALTEADDRMVRTALTAAYKDCPPSALPIVAALATQATQEDHRVLAIRLIGVCRDPKGLDVLLGLTAPRKGLFGSKPPAKTPEYLAALAALAAFAKDPRVRETLDLAARSSDAEIAATVRGAAR